MNIVELKTKIITNDLPNILVFTGCETGIMDIYIKQIQNKLGYVLTKCEDVLSVFNLTSGNSIFNVKRLFIVTDDLVFLKQDNTWKKLNKVIGSNKIILKYHNYDARLSFWKNFEEETVIFEKMKEDILAKHLNKDYNLDLDKCLYISKNCDKDYIRCKLELDKVVNYARFNRLDNNTAFEKCKEVLCLDEDSNIFDFIKYISIKDYFNALRVLYLLKLSGESSLKILSLLYSNFKNILIAQTIHSAKNVQQNTGINYYTYQKAKELSGYYDNISIENILFIISQIEQGIKSGSIDESIAIDYFLSNL